MTGITGSTHSWTWPDPFTNSELICVFRPRARFGQPLLVVLGGVVDTTVVYGYVSTCGKSQARSLRKIFWSDDVDTFGGPSSHL